MTSYAEDIKPLFRDRDRGAMQSHFDLWSYDDVVENQDAILATLAEGAALRRAVAGRAGRGLS